LVGDSQLVQLIAIVGLDGDGHGIALVRPLGTDGDGAVLAVLHADGIITAAGGRGSAAGGSGISNRDLTIAHAHAAAAAQRDLVLIISVSIEVNGHALTGDRDLLVTILRQNDGIAGLRGVHSLLQRAVLALTDLGGNCQLAVEHKGAEMLNMQHRAAILHSEAGTIQISLTGAVIRNVHDLLGLQVRRNRQADLNEGLAVQIVVGYGNLFPYAFVVDYDLRHRLCLIGDIHLVRCGQIRFIGGQTHGDLHHHFVLGLQFSLHLIDNGILRGLRHRVRNAADLRIVDDRFDLFLVFQLDTLAYFSLRLLRDNGIDLRRLRGGHHVGVARLVGSDHKELGFRIFRYVIAGIRGEVAAGNTDFVGSLGINLKSVLFAAGREVASADCQRRKVADNLGILICCPLAVYTFQTVYGNRRIVAAGQRTAGDIHGHGLPLALITAAAGNNRQGRAIIGAAIPLGSGLGGKFRKGQRCGNHSIFSNGQRTGAAILHAVRADQFCITLDRQVAYLGMIDDISLSGFQSAAGNHCLRIVGR
ncbi:N-substituted formamide deformylase, partial [Dysosmobacter welbionis]